MTHWVVCHVLFRHDWRPAQMAAGRETLYRPSRCQTPPFRCSCCSSTSVQRWGCCDCGPCDGSRLSAGACRLAGILHHAKGLSRYCVHQCLLNLVHTTCSPCMSLSNIRATLRMMIHNRGGSQCRIILFTSLQLRTRLIPTLTGRLVSTATAHVTGHS